MTPSKKKRGTKETKGEPLTKLTIQMPRDLHTRFKAGCAERGTTMNKVLIQFLENEFPRGRWKTRKLG